MEDMPAYITVRFLGMVLTDEPSERHIRQPELTASRHKSCLLSARNP
jgi:hypothetical protein